MIFYSSKKEILQEILKSTQLFKNASDNESGEEKGDESQQLSKPGEPKEDEMAGTDNVMSIAKLKKEYIAELPKKEADEAEVYIVEYMKGGCSPGTMGDADKCEFNSALTPPSLTGDKLKNFWRAQNWLNEKIEAIKKKREESTGDDAFYAAVGLAITSGLLTIGAPNLKGMGPTPDYLGLDLSAGWRRTLGQKKLWFLKFGLNVKTIFPFRRDFSDGGFDQPDPLVRFGPEFEIARSFPFGNDGWSFFLGGIIGLYYQFAKDRNIASGFGKKNLNWGGLPLGFVLGFEKKFERQRFFIESTLMADPPYANGFGENEAQVAPGNYVRSFYPFWFGLRLGAALW